jgi:hypothetical protein
MDRHTNGATLELLDQVSRAIRRPLILVGEQAYTVRCLHIRTTIIRWLNRNGDVA